MPSSEREESARTKAKADECVRIAGEIDRGEICLHDRRIRVELHQLVGRAEISVLVPYGCRVHLSALPHRIYGRWACGAKRKLEKRSQSQRCERENTH